METVASKRKVATKSMPATYEKIAARAYDLYLSRGSVDGFALEDWLTAETELLAAATSPAKKRSSKKTIAMSIVAPAAPGPGKQDKPVKAPRQRKATSAPTKKSRS